MSNKEVKSEVSYTVEGEIRVLAGEILTIVDAVIVDERANKATKDLIKSAVRKTISDYQRRIGKVNSTIELP